MRYAALSSQRSSQFRQRFCTLFRDELPFVGKAVSLPVVIEIEYVFTKDTLHLDELVADGRGCQIDLFCYRRYAFVVLEKGHDDHVFNI